MCPICDFRWLAGLYLVNQISECLTRSVSWSAKGTTLFSKVNILDAHNIVNAKLFAFKILRESGDCQPPLCIRANASVCIAGAGFAQIAKKPDLDTLLMVSRSGFHKYKITTKMFNIFMIWFIVAIR